jgi:leucyl/phenylalanyl-tRNA--protein transferase
MAENRTGPISWHSPDPRAIIPLETFHMSRSLRRTLKSGVFDIRFDTSFREVILACADREETWISEAIVEAYTELHRLGHGHSVESWSNGVLVGGLYGISIGGAFFGESMFTRATDASKVALVQLVRRLREQGYVLLDAQFSNPHLKQFAVSEITRAEYLLLLNRALLLNVRF